MAFTTFKKGTCPICGDAGRQNSNSCKENTDTGIIFCRTAVKDNTIGNHPDHDYIGDSKCGIWALFGVKRENWREKTRPVRHTKKTENQVKQRATISPEQRNNQYTKLLNTLSLSPEHEKHLEERGFTPEQIQALQFRSVATFPKVGKEFYGLPGVLRRGTLNIHASAILCPVTDENGFTVALNARLDDGSKGRYRWLTSKTENYPQDPTPHIEGELPVCAIPYQGKARTIWAVEGVTFKPHLTSINFSAPVIGASGGNFTTSKTLVSKALMRLSQQSSTKCITIPLDAGDIKNKSVIHRLVRNYHLFTSLGYAVQFAWWGQVSKSASDIDELTKEERQRIVFLSLEEIKELAIKWGGIVLEKPRPVAYYSLEKRASVQPLPEEAEEQRTEGQRWYRNHVHREQAPLRGLHHPPDLVIPSNQRYLPYLVPYLKHYQLIAIKSPKGCGKSRQLRLLKDYYCGRTLWKKKDTKKKSPSHTQLELWQRSSTPPVSPKAVPKEEYECIREPGQERPFISITSRIALGRAQSKENGSDWIDDVEKGFQDETGKKLHLEALLQEVKEIGICADSLWKLAERDWSNNVVFFDEIELNLIHMLTSDTCKEKRIEILETLKTQLKQVIASNGVIVLADADLSSTTIEFFEELLEIPAYIVTHEYKESPRKVTVNQGKKDKILEKITEKLQKDSSYNVAVAFSSKRECIAFCEYLKQEFPKLFPNPHDIIMINSDTSGTEFGQYFIENSNEALRKYSPRVLLYTSSLGVGCSIEVEHFDTIYGLYSGSVEPSQFRQQMARYRPPADWEIWVPERAHPKSYQKCFTPKEVRENVIASLRLYASLLGFDFAEELQTLIDTHTQKNACNNAHFDLYCKLKARKNYSLHNLAVTLLDELQEAGHKVQDCNHDERTEIGDKAREYKKAVQQKEAENIANAPDITLEAAIKISNQATKTPEEQALIAKAFLRNELPGLPLDKDTVYKLKDGDYLQAIKRWALLSNPDMLRTKEVQQIRKRVEAIASGTPCFLPDFRTNCPKIRLLRDIGIRDFVDREIVFHKNSPEVITFHELAYKRRQEIRTLFGITVRKDSDPIKLIERFLQPVGLTKVLLCVTQVDGKKIRQYKVDPSHKHDTLRQGILKALVRKHEQNASKAQQERNRAQTLCSQSLKKNSQSVCQPTSETKDNQSLLELGDLLPKFSQVPEEYRSMTALRDIASWLQACTSQAMLAELLECNIPSLVFTLAARLVPQEICVALRGWVQALRDEKAIHSFGDAVST